jgi:predicted DCC family thiol-disulfide oxidoreductase YuxK
LCNGTVRWVLRHEHRNDIVFAAIQSESGADLLRRAVLDPNDPMTFLFIENDRVLTRSDALIALANHLKRPWRWLTSLHFVPRRWRDALYDGVARNRFRLFGRTEVCLKVAGDVATRFLP